MNNDIIKFEIKHSLKKFEELFPDGNPIRIRQYKDKDGNIVDKEDVIKEIFILEVKIGDDTLNNAMSFGTFNDKELSLDNMTAREFIEDILIPHTMKMNSAIKRKYSN
jgi:hypothetical protein